MCIQSRVKSTQRSLTLLIGRIHVTLIFFYRNRNMNRVQIGHISVLRHYCQSSELIRTTFFCHILLFRIRMQTQFAVHELYILESARHVVNVRPGSEALFKKDLITCNVIATWKINQSVMN